MERISSISLTGHKARKQESREKLGAESYNIGERSQRYSELLNALTQTTIGAIDRKVKHGEHLSFEEAFCGMCFVLAATNNHFFTAFRSLFETKMGPGFSKERALVLGVAFLQLMAMKEARDILTPDEIAGMVAASMMDSVVAFEMQRVIETSGMGGDIGFRENGVVKKSINVSTLSSLVLAALDLPSVKHGSYSNTSAVGSTETIELFGAETSMNSETEVWRIWNKVRYCFFDAHWCKTIHDLSHLIMMETINHVIGPMTPPLAWTTEINKVMGVNEKVHPEAVARAYTILHQRKMQRVGGVIVVTGLDSCVENVEFAALDYQAVKRHAILDEVSPYCSVVSCAYGERYLGTAFLYPKDFGITIDPEKIKVSNNQISIHQANVDALSGRNPHLVDYLAMNAALGLFAMEYLPKKHAITESGLDQFYLRECFKRCHVAITSGKARDVLLKYVEVSGGTSQLL